MNRKVQGDVVGKIHIFQQPTARRDWVVIPLLQSVLPPGKILVLIVKEVEWTSGQSARDGVKILILKSDLCQTRAVNRSLAT